MTTEERTKIDALADDLTRIGIKAYGTSTGEGHPAILLEPRMAELVLHIAIWAKAKKAEENAIL